MPLERARDLEPGLTVELLDAEGEVVATCAVDGVDPEAVRAELARFVGDIEQVPTAVSAVKVDGKRAYARVRDGEQVELKARPVTIHELVVHDVALPDVRISVRCSSGTYIRAKTLPECVAAARRERRTLIVRLEIIDPTDPDHVWMAGDAGLHESYDRGTYVGMIKHNVNVIVDYTISVPQNTSVSVETVSGDVRAVNVRGRLNLESVSGNGNNAEYTIVKFVGITVVEVKLNGNPKRVMIQPAPYVDPTATVDRTGTTVEDATMFTTATLVE